MIGALMGMYTAIHARHAAVNTLFQVREKQYAMLGAMPKFGLSGPAQDEFVSQAALAGQDKQLALQSVQAQTMVRFAGLWEEQLQAMIKDNLEREHRMRMAWFQSGKSS
jgi:hypothetical protein